MRSSLYHYLDHFSNLGRAYGLLDTLLGLSPAGWDTATALVFLLYNRFAMECGDNSDSASKKLFEDLVAAEELHWDQFDRQADFIKRAVGTLDRVD